MLVHYKQSVNVEKMHKRMNKLKYVNCTELQEEVMLKLLGFLTSILLSLFPSSNYVFLCPFEGGAGHMTGPS